MNKPFQLAESSTRATFTTAEFLRMGASGAFDDMKIELIDGELERMMSPMSGHASIQAMLVGLLFQVAPRGSLLGEVGIDLGDDTVLACDAALLRTPLTDNRLLTPQDIELVVEVAQTSLIRDQGTKRIHYAAAGIPEYWVVDGDRLAVHVYREPVDGDYAFITTVRFGEPLAVPGTGATIVIA